jgi:hypothetical protein
MSAPLRVAPVKSVVKFPDWSAPLPLAGEPDETRAFDQS